VHDLTAPRRQPRAVPVIRVPDLDAATAAVGGTVGVSPFELAGVGRGCNVIGPAGVRLHAYDRR
jgi:hypothetical protein